MKSWKDVTLERIADLELAKVAAHEASKGKRHRQSVRRYQDPERLQKLVGSILDQSYVPAPVIQYTRYDKSAQKHREISCPAFRDQVVHWLLVLSMQKHFDRIFIQHAVANVPGRGVEYGRKLIKHWSRNKRATKWVLKLDIEKYYPSIPIAKLVELYSKYIPDSRVVDLISRVLRVTESDIGITLGSYFNQWSSIFYLSELDHYIKEQLQCTYYLRYVDDMLLLFPSKRKAERALRAIREILSDLGLRVKDRGSGKVRIFRWSDGFIDMLGYKTYRDGKQLLRGRNYLSLQRTYNRIKAKGASKRQARSLLSKRGLVTKTDCIHLLRRVDVLIHERKLKEIAYEN